MDGQILLNGSVWVLTGIGLRIGGIYTFVVRFKDAYDELTELDEKEPLSTMTG